MVLQLFTSTVVAVVEGSWLAASVFLKYFLVGVVSSKLYSKDLSLESFLQEVRGSSETVVLSLIVVGALISVSGLSFSPFLKLPSQLIALGYFGYLFWNY